MLLQKNCTRKEVAQAVGVSNSTITRELRRKRAAPGNRSVKPHVRAMAIRLLRHEQWSPEQISGYLIGISHETIYAIVRKDKMEGGILYTYCRHRHRPVGKTARIPGRVSIHLHPPEADGKRFGDFEMDTIIGRNGLGAILTIVERSTNMLFMKKLRWGKDARELARAAIALLAPYRGHIRTITTDNGMEFSCHRLTARALAITVYFTAPYASWQKGAVKNANGLVRQYVPKALDIRRRKDEDIDRIADKINDRPRKKLNFKTPKEEFFKFLS